MRLLFLPVVAALLLTGCGKPQTDLASEVQFAHFPADRSMSGPMGQLIAGQIGFENDFTPLKICIENASDLPSDDLLTEVRMSYAAWLASSEAMTEGDWSKLDFSIRDQCDPETQHSILKVGRSENIADATDWFSPQQIQCHTDGRFKRCSISRITLGVGRPGAMTMHFFRSNPDRWFGLSHGHNSLAEFNPFVDWMSLVQEILRHPDLEDLDKELLLAAYDDIKARGAAVSMAKLSAFVKEMERADLHTLEDESYNETIQEFYRSDAETLNATFRSRRSLFGTLLHEVGHQFGMDHADNPDLDSVTGATGVATQNEAGQWIAEDARMAYGDPMLFLTADDQAGVQSNAQHVESYLRDHFRER